MLPSIEFDRAIAHTASSTATPDGHFSPPGHLPVWSIEDARGPTSGGDTTPSRCCRVRVLVPAALLRKSSGIRLLQAFGSIEDSRRIDKSTSRITTMGVVQPEHRHLPWSSYSADKFGSVDGGELG
ncbi:uncharacterized protein BP5553_10703 [Venustampulla echinocandica]|uniref:Uncharacterized protein n=1 Tax=Venustampulla echinocandica TaxID=2656787 RepID=A0A370T8J1_9HELO|nr:uncharacterized protein BP5553_10703 [Venustampulla echinocandica]RDL29640.1 hypothetical protein BP5553_10703 [Venustampulla echinocandica]